MSDTNQYQRRQPPSPLVFSPDAILSPVPLQAQQSMASVNHGSGSGTVSMPFVRRHVTRRLKAAKAECDKELQRVTNNITIFFEERLREGDHETERDRRERDYDSQQSDVEPLRDAFVYQPHEFGSTQQPDECSSDGGYDVEPEYYRHGRQLSTASAQMSPVSLRRQSGAPWDRPLSSSVSSSAIASSPASSTIMLPDAPITRKQQPQPSSTTAWGAGSASRRLSRTIHIPTRSTQSGQSSRSTSRSRSPLPPLSSHPSFSEYAINSSLNRRSSRILVDDPVDPIMTALYEIISVATDVTEMTIAQLTAQPKIMESIVQRVQNIGKTWDDHPDWHGRNWYVQVLLAIASLSRVVEWWEAEKQFWNFDENEDEQDEPLMFVTKPAGDLSVPSTSLQPVEPELDNFRLNDDDDHKVRAKTPPTITRKSRDEHTKDVATHARLAPPTPAKATPTPSPSKMMEAAESARVLATERLRLQAETAQNQNIVMELSLDGDHFIWVNHAWRSVVGTEPDDLAGTRISSLLSRDDWNVFKEATQRLQEDDSHTVEVWFKLQVEPTVDYDPAAGTLYQQMEGKGMLMIDREDGQPSHTMWVIKPIAPARFEHDISPIPLDENDLAPEPASTIRSTFQERPATEPVTPFPFSQPISTEPILCRICECQIPQWYFEKHSETCVETHRLEAEIVECNESIAELRNTIRELCVAVDRPSPAAVPEYRGMQIFTPSSSPIVSSPLQLFRANKMQRLGVKKMQRRLLDQIEDILQVASEIQMPSLKEEEAKEPIERQRLLSPGSESKISQIRQWSKPTTEDAALGQLLQDAERVMRQKIDNVVRMQNTIRYSEKIWHEWQDRIENALAEEEGSGSDDGNESDDGRGEAEPEVNDQSSTASEYGGSGGVLPSQRPAEPLPVTSYTPSNFMAAAIRPASVSMISAGAPSLGPRQQLQATRSSTPSSVSSPLALAAPIVASSSPEEPMPPMFLDESPGHNNGGGLKNRKSVQNLLEPLFIVTPPTSPLVSARDASSGSLTRESSTKRSHRRHSTANLLTSPPAAGPLSPRLGSNQPLSRTTPTSIKDFDIIKPISKGAFGSVFLAKKKVTGDYYAIKVLKKADMIAKNQITNVKAERMILMKQAESPFVAKLYFTFQSKDNLYLVMEYLNGGDCAALIKSLGSLPEEWTKNYIAEVVLGLEYLHQRGVVHRDLKPDNLLIDAHGHLKLTDFGLSRIGLLGRQTRDSQLGRHMTRYSSRSRPPSMDSGYLASPLLHPDPASGGSSYFTQRTNIVPRIGNSPYLPPTDDYSESSGSESVSGLHARRSIKLAESPLQSFATELTTDLRSHSNSSAGTPPGEQKFVGTPDYLAPETILGLRGDDAAVDWWALGVITYEFLYGIPPFHAETPEKVFENILSGHIEWHEEWIEYSPEARDFMQALMTIDPNERLGAGGADEVKAHPFFAGIDWDKVTTTEAAFIPQVSDPESTDYFDPRGAIPQLFHDDDPVALQNQTSLDSPTGSSSMPPPSAPVPIAGREPPLSGGSDDFGSFSFKNLPVLKQANDDMIRKIKTDQMAPITHALTEPANFHQRKRSVSQRIKKPPTVVTDMGGKLPAGPPSPATSTSSIASSPSRSSLPPPTPSSSAGHIRKPSEYGAVERFKLSHMEGVDRRNSMPSRLRTASVSSAGDGSGSETWQSTGYGSQHESNTPPSSVHSIDLRKGPDPTDRAVTVLLAEDNPITAKIIETLLIRLGCRCVVVADGSEAISVAMGDIKFDCILMDLQMPVLDGEGAARYIKSTNGKNTNTPIIAVSAYSGTDPNETSNVFTASLAKPLQKADLIAVMRQLGFKTSPMHQGGAMHPKVTASHIAPVAPPISS
ncbi:hypothetical protein BDN70DRAFT_829267 [Pholiota conissans]|uniref:non-specific serine/threonine protein kinase n=1 Tax=Pholiota conissans TaxID=109636 RepID=A0A9P5Z8E4_9AGAR|nr:hypothetical protein BDN70DRAFT_829267 [Pholiota conissans]